MDGGAWWAEAHGVAKSRTRLSDFTFIFHFHALEKEMATHSGVLAWGIPWMEEPGRYSPWGRTHIVVHSLCPVSGCYSVSSLSPCEALPLPITW